MCFVPQRHALFRHLNVQKWSEHVVRFSTVDLEMCFAPTTARAFLTSQLPKVVRDMVCFVDFDLEMCFAPQRRALFRHRDSRHNGVHFLISLLTRWLRTRCFSEVTSRPSGAPNQWKNTLNRDFPTFSRTCIFLLLSLSLLWPSHFLTSPPWLFPLPDSSHLCFSISPYCRKFDL